MNVSDVQVGFVIILGTLASAFGSFEISSFQKPQRKGKNSPETITQTFRLYI